jgi:hypothetical protein
VPKDIESVKVRVARVIQHTCTKTCVTGFREKWTIVQTSVTSRNGTWIAYENLRMYSVIRYTFQIPVLIKMKAATFFKFLSKSIVTVDVCMHITLNMTGLWDIAPCSLHDVDRRFRRAYCLHHQGDE